MDEGARIVLTMLFTEHLRMRAVEARKVRMIGGAAHALRTFTENFIENMRAHGVQDAELEAQMRAASRELEAVAEESERNLIPPSSLGRVRE